MKKSSILIAVAAGFLLFGCGDEAPAKAAGAMPSLVTLAPLHAGDETAYLEYPATLRSQSDVQLLAKASGEVAKLLASDGEWVKKGQPLVQLDNEMALAQVVAAQADLAAANAELSSASAEFNRAKALKASTSKKEYEQKRAALLRAQAAVQKANAALKIAQINENHTRVYAPFSGQLGKFFVAPGDFVAASNSKIVRISDASTMRAEFFVPESDRDKFSRGAEISASFSYGGEQKTGKLAFIDSALQMASARAYAEFKDAGVPLESFVKLRLEGIHYPGAYRVAKANLLQDVNGYYVYLRREGKAAQVHVNVLFENEDFALIAADGSGIKDGEELIMDNYKKIHPGSAVASDAEFAAMMAAAQKGGASGGQKAGASSQKAGEQKAK